MTHNPLITVIAGTNRPGSATRKVAKQYHDLLLQRYDTVGFLSLEEVPHDIAYTDLWVQRSERLTSIILQHIEPASKFVFVMPEYNGGFPGVLKTFIDAVPPPAFYGKYAGLIGVSSGATGALRPMDQFTNVLNYLRVNVLWHKPKLSNINQLMNSEGVVVDHRAVQLLNEHADLMVNF